MSSQNKKKRKGSQSKKRHNNPEIVSTNVDFRCECSDETSLIQDITVERNSHEESTVDVSSYFGLMDAQSNSNLMCLQNKKMRKSLQPKKSRDSPETVSSNVDLQVVTSKTMAAPSRVEPSVDMIIKTVSEIAPFEIEALGDTCTKTELAVSPVEVNASVNTSIQIDSIKTLDRSKKKKTKRKRCKKHQNPLEHHDPDHVLLGGNSLGETMFLGKDSSLQPSADMCSKNELVMKQPDRDICFFSGHKASVDNGVVNSEIVNGMRLEKEDLKLACKVSELHLTNLTENLLAAEKQSCPSKIANRSSMEKHDGPSENDLVSSETNNMNTYKRKKVVKTYTRKERQGYYYSSVHGLDCVEKDNTRYISGDSLMNNVSVLPKGHLEQEDREKLDETHISVQVASHGDGISGKIPSDPMEDNGCGHDACCKYPERTVEVETKMADIFPSSSHLCVMRTDVVLDGTGQMENPKLNLQSSPERACIGHSKKKLLVLDVNGLLAHIVSHPSYRKPDIMVSMKAVYKRPYSDDFLQFCFERFNVGVWSSRVKKNLDAVVDCLLGDSRQNLLFCWDASHCSTTGLNTVENHRKPLVLKELKKLWEKLEPNLPWDKGEYNETNTLLLDDTPYKALCNPAYTAIFPYPYDHREANDFSLGPGGDLRVYLEGLAVAENVQEYVRQNPFGQRAVTKSHPSWNFYRKVFLVRPQPPYYDGNREIIYTKSCESSE